MHETEHISNRVSKKPVGDADDLFCSFGRLIGFLMAVEAVEDAVRAIEEEVRMTAFGNQGRQGYEDDSKSGSLTVYRLNKTVVLHYVYSMFVCIACYARLFCGISQVNVHLATTVLSLVIHTYPMGSLGESFLLHLC